MNKTLSILAMLAVCGVAGAAPVHAAGVPASAASAPEQGSDLRVRVWADADRDQFRQGERIRMQLHASRGAYAAVVHISTDGEVEFLYPRSPWDDGYVQGGRSYSLPYGGGGYTASWTVRGGPGIGYVFAIASDEPLDFRAFQDGRDRSRWGYRTIGTSFRGDPYYALDRLVDQLVPDPDYAYYVTDSYAYHVGGRHSYPRWACYDGYADAYGWGGHYDRCDRLRVLLRSDPYYYDPRRYRRSRGYYLADSRRYPPEHRYKEPRAAAGRDDYRDRGRGGSYDVPPLRRGGDSYDPPSRTRPEPRPGSQDGGGYTRADWQQGQQPQQEGKRQREERPRTEERSRPTLQRRPTEPETSRPRVTAPQREPRREAPPAREAPRETRRERPRSEPSSNRERSRPSEGGSARVRPEGDS